MRFLLLNQTFHPDVMATAQYLSEVAVALRERGHGVEVITSRRAYDNPALTFPASEIWRGVLIHRVGSTRFGKGAKWRRAADFASFLLTCSLRLLTARRPDVVVALTSPPLISFLGAIYSRLRRARFAYWVMDLNPDEAVAAGWLRLDSPAGRLLDWMSRFSFRHSTRIIALDRFMRDRIAAKETASGALAGKTAVLPPWSHDHHVGYDAAGRERFRAAHGLTDKFVVMYSGNHSPCHPLDTLLEAARQLAPRSPSASAHEPERRSPTRRVGCPSLRAGSETGVPIAVQSSAGVPPASPSPSRPGRGIEVEVPMNSGRDAFHCVPDRPAENRDAVERVPTTDQCSIVFCFIGGGSEFERVRTYAREHDLDNIVCLPYQPLDQLSASLSAADLHAVVMGDPFVGIVHPCKLYNVLAVGAPVLYVGPQPSHVTEMLDGSDRSPLVQRVAHGDVDGVVRAIGTVREQGGRLSTALTATILPRFSRAQLLPEMLRLLEGAPASLPVAAPASP